MADFFVSKEDFSMNDYAGFSIASDIGGTSARLGIFGKKQDGRIEMIFLNEYNSKKINKFSDCINDMLKIACDEYGIEANENFKAVFAVAGPVDKENKTAKPTNLEWNVELSDIINNTYIKNPSNISLLNDFEGVGYGIDLLDEKNIIKLNKAEKKDGAACVLGAGTGLGIGILYFDKNKKMHIPIASEGGHASFPLDVSSKEEIKLIDFVRKKGKYNSMPGYECLISGPGIANIFYYFSKNKKTDIVKEILKKNELEIPVLVTKNLQDAICKKTVDFFIRFYARAASNLALTSLAFGGVYIAGGIAPKIINEFKKNFIPGFEKNYRHSNILKNIPVYVVMDSKAGLYGAANFGFNFM